MQKPKKKTLPSPQESVNWLEYVNADLLPLVIPVGPRFQADVPEWNSPPGARLRVDSDNSRWFGTRIWPLHVHSAPAEGDNNIGKGRPGSCSCSSPGSVQCVRQHISEAKRRLESELGPAYMTWGFNEMGEDVGRSWTPEEKKRFKELVKTNPLSEGKSFLKPAVASFSSNKNWVDIVRFYLNVHVPKRISMLTRSGCRTLDSDDDEVKEVAPNTRNSLKRARSDHVDNTQVTKPHYLAGRR